jgi:hypothetical protein
VSTLSFLKFLRDASLEVRIFFFIARKRAGKYSFTNALLKMR